MRYGMLAIAVAVVLAAGGASGAGLGDLLKSADDAIKGATGTGSATALGGSLTDGQIDKGLKEALAVGAERAVAVLGTAGGYLDDPSVRIPLPGKLETAGNALRSVGQGALVDDFEVTVNRAAEEAVPQTLDIVKDTVTDMSLDDARGILNGGDDAATVYLRDRAGDQLHEAILPIISKATDKVGATAAYKRLEDGVSGTAGALLGGRSPDLDDYVADKTLDGLFAKLAEEERRIREDPVARSTELLKSVFGSN